MMASILRRVTAALLGIVAGHFYSLEVGTARVLDELDDEAYLRFKTTMDARYQRFVGPVWTASLLTGAAALVADRRRSGSTASRRQCASFAFNAAAFTILLLVNEPANAEHARILAGLRTAGGEPSLRRRWNTGQTARTWLVGAAFVLQLGGDEEGTGSRTSERAGATRGGGKNRAIGAVGNSVLTTIRARHHASAPTRSCS